jgi:putative ABC transport system permease protein
MREAFYTFLSRVRAFIRLRAEDADFDAEMEAHLAMAEAAKIRRGLSPDAARREARLELGGTTQLREAAREARGLPGLESFLLDARLGLRMLRKSWGLTLVGGLAMAVSIGLGASLFTIWDTVSGTRLPLDEGDRVMAIQTLNRGTQEVAGLTPLADFRRWRETLKSVEHVSAMRMSTITIVTRDGALEPVRAAEITASAFQLARVQPLMGRPLVDSDERPGAEPVAVIGHRLWEEAFNSDPTVLGQRLQVGDTPHLVVGVMPREFRFPLNHRLWTPLQTDRASEEGDVFVFARLAQGASQARAQTEVATIGLLPANQVTGATPRPEPRVVPYAAAFLPIVHGNRWLLGVIFLVGALLLVPPCANIAILVYARTVTRREEFATRTALGASRARIVMQVFVELLVLAAGAGVLGLFIARQYSGQMIGMVVPGMGPGSVPFWMDFTPSLRTVFWAAGLSVLAAAIAGGIPALHATKMWRRSGPSGIGNRAGARLGKTWMTLLATQVAVSLAILPAATEMIWGAFRPMFVGQALPLDEFLSGVLGLDGEDRSRFDGLRREVVRQLASEPGISGVAVSASVLMEEPEVDIEVEGLGPSDTEATFNTVDDAFFKVLGFRFLAGRSFEPGDFAPGRRPVIVNRSFVAEILVGGDALGRRVRYRATQDTRGAAPPPPEWHEIVGVVEDLPGDNDGPVIFHPMTTPVHPASVIVRLGSSGVGPAADRFRAVVAGLDSRLKIERLRSFEDVYEANKSDDRTFATALGIIVLIVLLFSMAGMYTLMTFIVSQRWREIGVRTALGAQPRRLLAGIFGRAAVPLLIGAAVGSLLGLRLITWLPIAAAGGRDIPGVILFSAAFMVLVGLVAVAGPARRAIRVNPTDALRVG